MQGRETKEGFVGDRRLQQFTFLCALLCSETKCFSLTYWWWCVNVTSHFQEEHCPNICLYATRQLDSCHSREDLGQGLIMPPVQNRSKSDCVAPLYPAPTVSWSSRGQSQIRVTEINMGPAFVNKLKICSNRLLTSNSCATADHVWTLIITFILSPQVQA